MPPARPGPGVGEKGVQEEVERLIGGPGIEGAEGDKNLGRG